jgi:formate hydrogenlyase transcriptional activator
MGSNALEIHRRDYGDPPLVDSASRPSQTGPSRWFLPQGDFSHPAPGAARDEHGIVSDAGDTARSDSQIRLFRAIGHCQSIAELTSVLAAEASDWIPFNFLGISRCDDATSGVEWHVAIPGRGIESGSTGTAEREGMTRWVYETQKPLVIASLDDATRSQSKILGVHEAIQSICAVPLSCAQKKMGALFVGSLAEHAYGDGEVRFLSLIAAQMCCAIEKYVAYAQIADLKRQLKQENLYLEEELPEEHGFDAIVGQSAALRNVLLQVETVAPTDCTVLICGETGTGKELIARAVHDHSARRAASFVKLNCAAIPTGLLESELFGHEKGAFTGAISQRVGRFELANRGTMFLDEIGEVPLELQPKLLRVLQEREFERLGNSRTLHTDTRLIAATNRDLEQMVEENRFRSDLFYRLNVFPIRIPALRERPEDVPLLVRHFARMYAKRMNKQIGTISSETMETLCAYHWPGNIRELQNVIERAVVLTKGTELRVQFTELKRRSVSDGSSATGMLQTTLKEVERDHILATLKQTGWVIAGPNGAAARLGMRRTTLQFRMKKLGISIVRVGKQ